MDGINRYTKIDLYLKSVGHGMRSPFRRFIKTSGADPRASGDPSTYPGTTTVAIWNTWKSSHGTNHPLNPMRFGFSFALPFLGMLVDPCSYKVKRDLREVTAPINIGNRQREESWTDGRRRKPCLCARQVHGTCVHVLTPRAFETFLTLHSLRMALTVVQKILEKYPLEIGLGMSSRSSASTGRLHSQKHTQGVPLGTK
ncbi:hypothetical protein RUM43_013666 [Polyplax serrata]|uniref:Uncharacterized protein n=1 Tax=Polyplax serrata TaxID=468196 RepID=A0AAN8NW61_POLSC